MRTPSVDTTSDFLAALDLDPSALFAHRPAFPSPDLVRAAAGLLTPLPARWSQGVAGRRYGTHEGARPRLVIGPGVLAVSEVDPARADRAEERRRDASWKAGQLGAADLLLEDRLEVADQQLDAFAVLAGAGLVDAADGMRLADEADWLAARIERRDNPPASEHAGRKVVTIWSTKSRARMVRRLAELDYGPLFAGGGLPAMLTLTLPGDWQAVAPSPAACKKMIDAFKRRFLREYGTPLIGIWKREFQRRGAPHWHILMVPPAGFHKWVGPAWAAVVGSASCGSKTPVVEPDGRGRNRIVCCERHRHIEAGTGIDFAEGMRARDPKRLAVYFSKHGMFSAKDYQNAPPAGWVPEGASVGRFWGVWGLDVATVTVEVSPVEALAAARTMRRWQRANGYRVQREVWRTDTRTGVQRRRRSGVWAGARMRGRLGFVIVNDGAAFAGKLAGYLDQVREAAQAAEIHALRSSPAWVDMLAGVDVDQGDDRRRCCVLCGGRLSADFPGVVDRHAGDCSPY